MNELKRSQCEHHDYKTQAAANDAHNAHNGKAVQATRTYDGKIISVRFTDDGETVVHIKLDTPDKSIEHCHVRIECIPE